MEYHTLHIYGFINIKGIYQLVSFEIRYLRVNEEIS